MGSINAAEIVVTANNSQDKKYYRHSTYPGGITETNFQKLQERFPGRAIQKAVKGMLPKGPMGYAMAKKLKVYAGAEQPHSAQQHTLLALYGAVLVGNWHYGTGRRNKTVVRVFLKKGLGKPGGTGKNST